MPAVRKLTDEEIAVIERKGKTGKRQQIESMYDLLVADFQPGDYAELELEPDETKLTVRSRVNRAMQRRGMAIDWVRSRTQNVLKFRVRGDADTATADTTVDETDETAALQEFELPSNEPEPEPVSSDVAPTVAAPKNKPRRSNKAVTQREPFIEAA